MSLKSTEEFYNRVIEHVAKEIRDDPQLQNISNEAIEHLEKAWKNKLQLSGVYTPPNDPKVPNFPHHYQMLRPATHENLFQQMVPSSTTDPRLMRLPFQYPQGYNPLDPAMWMAQNRLSMQNIQFNAKPTLTSGIQPQMPQPFIAPQLMNQVPPSVQNMMNININERMQVIKMEPLTKSTINIKTEPTREEEEHQNDSKGLTKATAVGNNQGLIDISTPRRSMQSELSTPLPKENKNTKPQSEEDDEEEEEEEERKEDVFQSDNGGEEDNAQDVEEDDEKLFEFVPNENKAEPKVKEEHIPSIQQGNVISQVPVDLMDLNPYDPQERPLDSDDDPDYGDTSETTNILTAFYEKVHRHGSKWKVTLKSGIMNAKGKEYILSHINGEFDFMQN